LEFNQRMDRGFGKTDELPKQEKILRILRRSRKSFVIEYVCAIIIFIVASLAYAGDYSLPNYTYYFLIMFGVAALIYGEITRAFLVYRISDTKLSIIHGLVKQTKKNINYHPLAFIPEISLKQTRLQRFLDIGDVYVQSGGNSFHINDIDHPQEIMELIEALIEKTRKKE
jgi:uncharacterized membrane protein YdbT with pleckstrin-like domain